MDCLSHPGKKLIEHLTNVKELGLSIINYKDSFYLKSYNKIINIIEKILFYHDFGKATKFFQNYLKASMHNEKYESKIDLSQHALLSACFSAYNIKKIFGETKDSLFFSILGYIVVKKHHGNFENLEEMFVVSKSKWKILQEQWNNIVPEFEKEKKGIEFNNIKEFIEDLLWNTDLVTGKIDNYFFLNFLFSLLVYSDKAEVIVGKRIEFFEFPDNINQFIDNYKNKIFNNSQKTELNFLREEAYNISLKNLFEQYKKGNIFSLNLPTGTGKTLTVLNIAFNLIKKEESLKRVIYALPFTSIVDQIENIIRDIFQKNSRNPDDYLIVHHHLAEVKIKTDENYIEGDKAEFLIENWDKPLILTTFWQLFNSIITNKNSQLRKFHNLTNSIIILDEVQTIPYKYWKLINKVLKKLSQMFNIKIIFLTATMPLIFEEEKKEIISLLQKERRDYYFSKFTRYKIELLNKLDDITIKELFEIAKKDIENNKNKSFLFVFNTIRTSIDFFNKLREYFPNKELIYLSSNILPFERKKRIEKIKNNSKSKIIISTQVIEAGVDIDLDIVYRDFAPLDSIIQSAGRCNRNNKKEIGVVRLFRMRKDDGEYDYKYIYKGLALEATNKIFKCKSEIKESEILKLIIEYYQEIKGYSSKNESDEILEAMKNLEYTKIGEKFKLIDEIPSFLLFLEINDKASEILNKFIKIMKIENRFIRKNEFLKIKAEFYQYILSVKINKYTLSYKSSFKEIGGIKIVSNDMINSVYDYQTGLKKDMRIFL